MDLSISEEGSFTFGVFLFRPGHQILCKGGEEVRLGSRAASILHLLVSRARTLVSKDELIAHAWPSTTVDEANLKVHICTLRRVLGDTRGHTEYIATVPGRGYQFIAPVMMTNAVAAGGPYDVGVSRQGLPSESRIVGRDQEIQDVTAAFTSASVVTLAGPVGVGKASIARAAAAVVGSRFDAGCCIVDFSLIDDLSAVPNFVAAALGLRSTSTDMTGALLEYLEHRSILILLDHCERVMDALRLMIARLSASRTSSAFLLVSLEPLRVPNESVHRIGLLPYPLPGNWGELSIAEALAYPAIAMLVDRAHSMSGYKLLKEDIAAIAGICHITDGRPRSIASALSNLLGHFSFDDMLDIVTRRVLFGPQAGEPDDPSCLVSGKTDFGYERLSSDEATLLRLLSLFAGAFELEDVVRMVEPTGWDAHQTFMVLSSLIAKSFVWVEPAGPVARYRILAAERFLGRSQLREAQRELEIASSRHAHVILQVFEKAQSEWPWIEPEVWRARYASRSEDLIEAIEWAAGPGADAALELELTASAIRLWDEQSDLTERRNYLERALRVGQNMPDLIMAKARIATSYAWSLTISSKLGDVTARAWKDAVELALATGDDECYSAALLSHFYFLTLTGSYLTLESKTSELEQMAKRASNHALLLDAERFKSFILFDKGDVAAAEQALLAASDNLSINTPVSRSNRYRWERYATINSSMALLNFVRNPSGAASLLIRQVEDKVGSCHPHAQAQFLMSALPIAYWRRDPAELVRLVETFTSYQSLEKADIWAPVIRLYSAASEHLSGQPEGFERMRDIVNQLLSIGLQRRSSLHLSMVAEAAVEVGRVNAAAELMARAFEQQERCPELWYVPELLRVEAKVIFAAGDGARALDLLRTAKEKAIQLGVGFFATRIQLEADAIQGLTEPRQKKRGRRYEAQSAVGLTSALSLA